MTDMREARHITFPVKVGGVTVGGGAPIVVQSMTNTDTADVGSRPCSRWRSLRRRARSWCASRWIARRRRPPCRISETGSSRWAWMCRSSAISTISATSCWRPYPACAEALAKYRINPGNVGFRDKRDKQFSDIIEIALKHDKPVRIGVNWGSLDQELLARMMDENAKAAKPRGAREVLHEAIVHSATASAELAQSLGMGADKIILSAKVSAVQDRISVYAMLAARCTYALHLGLTEADVGSKGIVASAAALGILLQKGIGDTIRVSLTPEPGGARTKEVEVAQQILQTMGFRTFVPIVAACPGCGRTTSTLFQEMARDIQNHLLAKMPEWRKTYPGVRSAERGRDGLHRERAGRVQAR